MNFFFADTGSSADPCNLNYAGPAPYSEPETQALRDFLAPLKDKIDLYLPLHSFGQLLLGPFGNGAQSPVPNQADLNAVGAALVASQNASNYKWIYGPAQFVLGSTSGTARDYAYGELGIPLTYTYEFEPDINSDLLFFLPNNLIRSSVERFVAGLAAMVRKGAELGYFKYEHVTWKDIICREVPKLCH